MAKLTNIGKNRAERRKALIDNQIRINKLIDRFYNTATSIFSYNVKGLSKYHNRLFSNELEHLLFYDGWATIFKDPKDDIIKIGRISGRGKIGQYRQFENWSAVMGNGDVINNLNTSNAIIVYNNKKRIATQIMILDDITNMIDVDTSIIQHIKATRVPFVFSGNENDMLAFKTMYEDAIDGTGAFFLDKEGIGGMSEPFKVWNADVEYKGDKLMMLYEAFENRVFTLLGIQSNRIDKKAQIGEAEVDKNDDVILINFEAFYSERQYAIEIAKELGIEIELNINEKLIKQGEHNGKDLQAREDRQQKEKETI